MLRTDYTHGEVVMSEIFLTYRRSDCLFKADRLSERLGRQFEIFRDLESLSPTVNWATAIKAALDKRSVHIVMIGKVGLRLTSPSAGQQAYFLVPQRDWDWLRTRHRHASYPR